MLDYLISDDAPLTNTQWAEVVEVVTPPPRPLTHWCFSTSMGAPGSRHPDAQSSLHAGAQGDRRLLLSA